MILAFLTIYVEISSPIKSKRAKINAAFKIYSTCSSIGGMKTDRMEIQLLDELNDHKNGPMKANVSLFRKIKSICDYADIDNHSKVRMLMRVLTHIGVFSRLFAIIL